MVRWLKVLPLAFAVVALSVIAISCNSSSNSAQVRFVNAVQNTSAYGSGLDVEINNTKVFTNIAFPNYSASTYKGAPAGGDTVIGLETNTSTQVFSDPAILNAGTQSTLVAAGFAGGQGVGVLVKAFTDTNTAPAQGNVNFRVINASPSGPTAVDVYIEQTPFSGSLVEGTQQISNLAYGSASSYVTLPWNSDGSGWTIIVTVAGSTTPYNGFNFNTGNVGGQSTEAIRTLVLTDVENGSSMSTNPNVLSDLN